MKVLLEKPLQSKGCALQFIADREILILMFAGQLDLIIAQMMDKERASRIAKYGGEHFATIAEMSAVIGIDAEAYAELMIGAHALADVEYRPSARVLIGSKAIREMIETAADKLIGWDGTPTKATNTLVTAIHHLHLLGYRGFELISDLDRLYGERAKLVRSVL